MVEETFEERIDQYRLHYAQDTYNKLSAAEVNQALDDVDVVDDPSFKHILQHDSDWHRVS